MQNQMPRSHRCERPKGCTQFSKAESLAQARLESFGEFSMKTSRGLARHAWSQPSRPSEHWTERVCLRCGIRKVTRHDGGDAAFPWTEFYDELGLMDRGALSGPTPRCEPQRPRGVAA